MQFFTFVKVFILQGINNIKAANPKQHGKGIKHRHEVKCTCYCNVGAYRSKRKAQAQYHMAQGGKPFRITVK